MPWPRKGGVWCAASPASSSGPRRQHLRDQRVEGVDRRALDLCLRRAAIQRDTSAQMRSGCTISAGSSPGISMISQRRRRAADLAVGHRPRRVAVLHRVVGQAGHVFVQQHVEHQPGLVQAEVVHRCGQQLADQRARAVAADDVAGVELAHVGDLATEMDRHVREARDAGAQDLFELRLVKIPVARPAVRPGAVDAGAEPSRFGRRH